MSTDTRIPAEPAAPGDGQERAAPERHDVELNRCAVGVTRVTSDLRSLVG